MSDFRLFASEQMEEGERVSPENILREIHELMCMCGAWDNCCSDGVSATLLNASKSLLAVGTWSTDFEDGWIRIEKA